MATPIEERKQPGWRFSRSRKEALRHAQEVHVILINIGKKYRNKEAHMFKITPKVVRAAKRVKK